MSGIAETEFGTVTQHERSGEVRFHRDIAAPVSDMWELIATGPGLARWLADSTADVDDVSVEIDFGEGGLTGGPIIDIDAGRALEYHWRFPGERDSIVRFELATNGDGTRVHLKHWLLPLDQTVSYAAGWHAHLDSLEAVAQGHEPPAFMRRFLELLPQYQ